MVMFVVKCCFLCPTKTPTLGEAAGLETLSEDLRNDRDIVLAAVRTGVRWMFELRNGIGSCLKHSRRIFFSHNFYSTIKMIR